LLAKSATTNRVPPRSIRCPPDSSHPLIGLCHLPRAFWPRAMIAAPQRGLEVRTPLNDAYPAPPSVGQDRKPSASELAHDNGPGGENPLTVLIVGDRLDSAIRSDQRHRAGVKQHARQGSGAAVKRGTPLRFDRSSPLGLIEINRFRQAITSALLKACS